MSRSLDVPLSELFLFGAQLAHDHRTGYLQERVNLATDDALVDQDFNLTPTILSPPGRGLVRGRLSVFAHRARRHDMPHRHISLLHEIGDYGFSAVLAEFRVHRSATGRVSIACHLDDVSFQASGGFRQLLEFFLVLHRDTGATDIEVTVA